jgi:uncharacterized membrane-anchored protein YitT (DUF2179 family)
LKAVLTSKQRLQNLALILAGSTLIALATFYVFDPAGLITGGFSGLAIIIKSVTGRAFGQGVPLWLSSFLLNIPVFLLAWKTDGLHSILKSALSWLVMTAELAVFPSHPLLPDNLLLVSIYGGAMYGIGTGLLLSAHATSGGTDMLGNSLHHFHLFRCFSIGRIIQVLDGTIVILGLLEFGLERTLYAILSVYLCGKLTDYVIGRGLSAKIALIISNCNESIAKDIMTDLSRGVTGLRGRGMYSGKERTILVCICSNKDIVDIKDIVHHYDPKAFFIIGNVNEAMGEGFVETWN